MATLVANNAEVPVSRVLLRAGMNTLGRAEGNHHVIPHASVSSRHCEMILTEGLILVRDLGSTNGTFVDGKQIAQAPLADGQRLRLGNVEYLVEAPEFAAAGSGPLRVNISKNVNTVETANAPAIAPTAREVIAAMKPEVYEEPSFYRSLPRMLTYPFNKRGMALLAMGAIFFLIMNVAARFAFLFWIAIVVFTNGYLFAYMQRIVSSSAQGEDDVPDFPDVTEFWSDIVLPFLLFTGTFVVSFAPAIVVAVWMRESEMMWPAIIATVGLGILYFPMALLAVAVTDNFLALSPHVVVPSIALVLFPYLLACVVLGILVALRFALAYSLSFLPLPLVPSIIDGFVSLYLLVVEMRILGLLFRSYRGRLGWL
jgi:hypothetical protein